jgi:hypothetical protein
MKMILPVITMILLSCMVSDTISEELIFKKWKVEKVEVDSNYRVEELEMNYLDILKEETRNAIFEFKTDSSLIISKDTGAGMIADTSAFSIIDKRVFTYNAKEGVRDTAIIRSITKEAMVLRFDKEEKRNSFTIYFIPLQ